MSTAPPQPPVERRSLLAGGTRTRLVQAGPAEASEAVVFVHGNPGSADDWVGLAGVAAGAGKRAVAFDLPDFGETVAPDGFEPSAPAYAGFVDQVLAELGIERVHLVMHDFGGPIGLTWAATHLDSVASVTLIDTGLLPGYRWHSLARIWRTPVLGELFQATATRRAFRFLLNRNEPRGLPREFVETMYDHYDRRTRKAVLELYRATDDPGGMSEALAGLFAERGDPGAGDLGRAGRLPAFRVCGAAARGVSGGGGPRAAGQRALAVRRRARDGRAAVRRIPSSRLRPHVSRRADGAYVKSSAAMEIVR